ncbi:MAG: sugar ABC transporter permease [Armatimonadetes bacterium]|nr:sugar ABC transporter permease [Armatimonadota bacterium]
MKRRRRESLVSLVFCGPAIALYLAFVIGPALLGFAYGLTDWSGWSGGGQASDLGAALGGLARLDGGAARAGCEAFLGAKFVGLANYAELAHDPVFANFQSVTAFRRSALGFTLFETLLIVLTFTFGAMVLAVLLDRVKHRVGLVRGLFFYPFVLSLLVSSLLFLYLGNYREGAINKALAWMGLSAWQQDWLMSPTWAPWTIFALVAWTSMGFFTTLYLANLQAIPEDLYEAAALDGAGPLAVFRAIQFPLLMPTVLTNSVLALINGINLFGQVVVTTQGGPGTQTFTLGYYIYHLGRLNNRQGYASAVSFVVFVLLAAIAIVQATALRRRQVEL